MKAGRDPGVAGPDRGSLSMVLRSCQRRSPWGRVAAKKCPSGPRLPRREETMIPILFFFSVPVLANLTRVYEGCVLSLKCEVKRLAATQV